MPIGTFSDDADAASGAASLATPASIEAFVVAFEAPDATLLIVPPLDLPQKLSEIDDPRLGKLLLEMLPWQWAVRKTFELEETERVAIRMLIVYCTLLGCVTFCFQQWLNQ